VEPFPRILETYLFCKEFRCLPHAGGYYDQNYSDMLYFKLIEGRVGEIRRREDANGKRA